MSEKASYTQLAKAFKNTCELWDRALRQLQMSKEDRDIVAIIEEDLAGNDKNAEGKPSVKDCAEYIKEHIELQIKGQKEDSDTHRFVKKTVSVLNRFISFGDIAVSFDPVHAALPWAAVRFVLVASGS